MEIKKFMDLYLENPPEEFFKWWFERTDNGIMEIRFLSDRTGNKFNNWNLIKKLSEEINCFGRKLSLFINSYQQYEKIILYKLERGEKIREFYNLFFSINPKKRHPIPRKDNSLYKGYSGKYGGVRNISFFGFDIEFENREGEASEAQLDICIQGAQFIIDFLKLQDYYLNLSGSGIHLISSLDTPIEIPEMTYRIAKNKWGIDDVFFIETPEFNNIKRSYWNFIEYMDKKLKEFFPMLKVDEGCKDFTRILRPPASKNVKVKRTPRYVGTIKRSSGNNTGIRDLILGLKPKETKSLKKAINKIYGGEHRYTATTLYTAPIVQLLLSRKLPEGGRNHYLELQLALLMRQNKIAETDCINLINEIDIIQQKNINIRPEYLNPESTFNTETVNTWCINNGIMPIYEIMLEKPLLQENERVTNEQFDEWDSCSWLSSASLEDFNYQNIKEEIKKNREISSLLSKQEIYLRLKKSSKEHKTNWEFWKEIVRILLNKFI